MRNFLYALCILPVTCLLLACSSGELESGAAGSASADVKAEEGTGFVGGLLDRARDMMPVSEEAAAEAAAEQAAVEKEAIVRCEVQGVVTFTRESQCDNRGGQSLRMALKKK